MKTKPAPAKSQKTAPDATVVETPPARETSPRLSLPLRNDGALALDSMRDSTKEQLKKILQDENVRLRLGLTTPGATASDPLLMMDDAWAGALLSVVSQAGVNLAARLYHCSPADAAIVALSDDERAALSAPLVRVVNKYAGSAFLKYGDEITLLSLLAMTGAGKMATLKAQLAVTRSARGPVDIRRPRETAEEKPRMVLADDPETVTAEEL